MSRQPLQLAVVSLQLPLQLLDLLLSRPFYAPTPTVRADVPARSAWHIEDYKCNTCAEFTAAHPRLSRAAGWLGRRTGVEGGPHTDRLRRNLSRLLQFTCILGC